MLLALFDWNGSVHVITAIYLQTLLICTNIKLDPGDVAGHGQDRYVCGFRGRVTWAVKYEGVVISSTVEAAGVRGENIGAYLLGGSKIEGGVVHYTDGAVWDFDVVDLNVACCILCVMSVLNGVR